MKKLSLLLILLSVGAYALNSLTFTQTTFSCTTTSSVAIAARPYRKYFLIQNRGSTSVYIKPDSAHSGTEGIEIIAGGNWEPIESPQNSFYCKAASGTDSLTIIEGN